MSERPMIEVMDVQASVFADGRMQVTHRRMVLIDVAQRAAVRRSVGPNAMMILEELAALAQPDERGRLVAHISAEKLGERIGASDDGVPHSGWGRKSVGPLLAKLAEKGFVIREQTSVAPGRRRDGRSGFSTSWYVLSDKLFAVPDTPVVGTPQHGSGSAVPDSDIAEGHRRPSAVPDRDDAANGQVASVVPVGDSAPRAAVDVRASAGALSAGPRRVSAGDLGIAAGRSVVPVTDSASRDDNMREIDDERSHHHLDDNLLWRLIKRRAVDCGWMGGDSLRRYAPARVLAWVVFLENDTSPRKNPGGYLRTVLGNDEGWPKGFPTGLRAEIVGSGAEATVELFDQAGRWAPGTPALRGVDGRRVVTVADVTNALDERAPDDPAVAQFRARQRELIDLGASPRDALVRAGQEFLLADVDRPA